MKSSFSNWRITAPAFFLSGCLVASALAAGSATAARPRPRIDEAYGKLPISFEANRGQSDARVRFLGRVPGFNLFLTPSEAVLDLRATGSPEGGGSQARKRAVMRMKFVNANPKPHVAGMEELPGKVNYLRDNNPKKWKSNIPTYRKVKYEALYPGVDLIYYGNQRQLEYDFVVAPGANPKQIVLELKGAGRLEVDARGDLLIDTALGTVRHPKPHVYQEQEGGRQEVSGDYMLMGSRRFGFRLGPYDQSKPLIIDPVLVYSTYLGGSSLDEGRVIAVDAANNVYVAGFTTSANFPTTSGAFDTSYNGGNEDAFVTKLSATGASLVYSTYLGGSAKDDAVSIAVDAAGNAYMCGGTVSTNFPVTAGAFRTTNPYPFNEGSAFISKLNPTGASLVYSTYLGGNHLSGCRGIAVDGAGSAYVTGQTLATNFPTTSGAYDTTFNGFNDAYVTKLNASGTALVYSTYLGGNYSESPFGIAVDSAGNAYVTGVTGSLNYPTTAGAFDTTNNGGSTSDNLDGFVTKLNPSGASLMYSTYLGGSGDELPYKITVDAAGDAYVAGETSSSNFPTTAGAFDTTFNGGGLDGFVTKLNATGASLVYSTYLGGSALDACGGIIVDMAGTAYLVCGTRSADFPTTPDAFDAGLDGIQDVIVLKLNPTGTSLVYSTYLGGSGHDDARGGIAMDSLGNVYVSGLTDSTNFPTTPGAFDTTFNGGFDTFVAKIGEIATFSLTPAAATNTVGTAHAMTATVLAAGGQPVAGIAVRFAVTGSVTTSGICTTDANGQCTFTYTGPTAPGADTISAYADTNNNSAADTGEPTGSATKTWVSATPAAVTLAPATATNPVGTSHTMTVTVQDSFGNPTSATMVRFTVTGSVTTSGSCTTGVTGQCTFAYTGPTAPGADTINAYADTNNNTTQDSGEPAASPAAKTWVAGAPANITLSPATATNPVGTSHTTTATVQDSFGNPTSATTVRFTVTGSVTTTGSCTTNTTGQCTFTYTGPTAPGADTINAYADTNNNTTQDSGEPAAAPAAKTWVAGAPANVTLSPATATNPVGTSHTVTATVQDSFGNPTSSTTVRFMVTGSVTATGSCATGTTGQCAFTYAGPNAPGSDAINAYADTNNNTVQDTGEPGATPVAKTWVNQQPVIISLVVNPAAIDEDGTVTLSGAFTDSDSADSHVVVIDWRDGGGAITYPLPAGARAFSFTHQYLDDNPTGTGSDIHNIAVSVSDNHGGIGSGSVAATVRNLAPAIVSLTGPADPLSLGAAANMSLNFTDAGRQDTHACSFAWDDGLAATSGTVTESAGAGACTGSRTYTAAGVYTVQSTITDDDTGSASKVHEYIVVYDPSAGFVTGGGWLNSPAGAYAPNTSLTGRANFGFVSKYQKGANTPTGQTQFQFQVASFTFHSSSYDWLVVAGSKAQFKGSGTIGGSGDYGFLLTARDGQRPGGGGVDKFRIKIWNKSTNAVIYDNKTGSSDDMDSADPQEIAGGSIVIHEK